MPKPTFHNLPKDKQSRIIDAAIDEFASVPFDAASVNRIVRGAKIAKGSFYQYFENMVDLYANHGRKVKFVAVCDWPALKKCCS